MKSTSPAAVALALTPIVRTVTNNPRANPRQLKPSQLLQLVNSTPLGGVLTDTKLRQHRQAAGLRIGEGRSIDFVRYAAWLAVSRVRQNKPIADDPYSRKKKTERERQARKSREGRELGDIPPPRDPARKERCRLNLQLYLETYFAEDFPLAWSNDHLKLIKAVEQRILGGGLKAVGMPRGTGKTTLIERAVTWGANYGHQRFIGILGANQDAAIENLETIKTIYETNELLEADFPEICVPIIELQGIVNKCKGQTFNGKRTRIGWSGNKVILPTIDGSAASGVIIQASGILARVRGMKHKTKEETRRPSFCLIDDPQTDASARSDNQIAKRMKVMTGAVLGLAGPGVKMAAVAAVTVIRVGDMADQILDRDAHPEWDGLRTKMLYGEAKNRDLLDVYWDMRAEEMRTGDGTTPKTNAWYRENQTKIEAGFEAAWPERKNADEVSAIQHAINLIQDRGKDIFDAEYQNDPQPETSGDDWHISAVDIAAKVNGLPRGIVPLWATKLTAFCDIQQRLLYWGVVAWGDKRGALIDYGAWPEQKAREFSYKDIRNTLARLYPKRGVKGAIKAGLTDLANHILARDWKREDNTMARVSMLGIDAGNWTTEVHEFIRTSKFAGLMMPCKGKGITADKTPISEWRRKPAEQIGEEWILVPQPKHASRLLTFDTNYWKKELFIRLATPMGEPNDLSLFGSETVLTHRMLASHFHAESFNKTEGQGRSVYVFTEKPGRPDNHLFDVAVGSLVMTMPGVLRKAKKRQTRKATYL